MIQLPYPDDSLSFFEQFKILSEQFWANSTLNDDIYGFQIQANSQWQPGLSEAAIADFEQQVGLFFPEALKNFYRTMNGLNRPAVNVFGESGTPFTYKPVFYSYPNDIPEIRKLIDWIEKANNLDKAAIEAEQIPAIFPIVSHRFLIIDDHLPILSMYGDDIIYWADNISKLLATHLFKQIENQEDFKSNPRPVDFWL